MANLINTLANATPATQAVAVILAIIVVGPFILGNGGSYSPRR